jgi:prepilin-type N-terminal cleavage/methylation domain-containing protein
MRRSPNGVAAFTLLELLTVIVVAAILAGIGYPAFVSILDQAHKTQAKNEVQQILTAVNGYYTEYGKYPLASGTDVTFTGTSAGITSGSSNAALFDVLRNNTNPTGPNFATVTSWNPRAIVFVQPPISKSGTKGGVNSTTGIWYDPWGSSYNVMIDGSYNNQLTNPYADAPGGTTLYLGVIVWSFGKNGALGGGAAASGFSSAESGTANNFNNSGDVISWQ